MKQKRQSSPLSLMSQTFAQRAFIVFFLGSVVPLGFLAFLGDEYVLPHIDSTGTAAALQAGIVLTAVLAFLSFYVLSRAARETTDEMTAHNQRLRTLVKASQSLTSGGFVDTIAHETLASAAALTASGAGLLFLEAGPAEEAAPAPLTWGPGADLVLAARREGLRDLVAQVSGQRAGRVVSRGDVTGSVLLGQVDGFGELASVVAAPVLAQGRSFGVLVCLRKGADRPFDQAELDLVSSLSSQVGIAIQNARLQESEKNFFTHVTGLLVEALDRFALQQPGHSKRVAYYCAALGRELGLEPERRERLFFAALLHDVGMLRLSNLQVSGSEHYVDHPRLGHDMIRVITLWADLAPFILHHHERYDGTGYPDRLVGEAIPLEARIITLADAFDAMTSPSSYRPWRPAAEALREIEELAGAQFDPAGAAALAALVRRGEIEVAAT